MQIPHKYVHNLQMVFASVKRTRLIGMYIGLMYNIFDEMAVLAAGLRFIAES